MNLGLWVDVALVVLLVGLAVWAVAVRDGFAAIIGFVAYGLLLMLAWLRLAAPDVALTEGAVSGGLSGLLLFGAWSRLRGRKAEEPSPPPGVVLRVGVGVLCGAVVVVLSLIVLRLPEPGPSQAVAASLPLSGLGMENPVTAVLIAYRALDTLLEVVVLFLALVGVWSLASDRAWGRAPRVAPEPRSAALTFEARVLPAFGLLVGLYIFWNGSKEQGGEFPGGAVLAAMGLLVLVAGLATPPAVSRRPLRWLLAVGSLVFFLVALAGFGWAEAFLGYPEGWAKPLILTIEAPLVFTIAATLAALLAGPPASENPS